MFNVEDTLKEAYSLFSERLSYDDFKKKLDSLKVDKWKFIRAVSLYQQSMKCTECNPNVGMILLISCADALQLVAEDKSWQNAKKFFLDYCPQELRISPIKYRPKENSPSQTAPFEKSIRYIYKKFRCLYVHEGKGRLDIVPEPEGEKPKAIFFFMTDAIKGEKDRYSIDLMKIRIWFGNVTIESLFAMLLEAGKS